MTRRKPYPTGYCPRCGVQYLALTRNELMNLALSHVESEHPDVITNWVSA